MKKLKDDLAELPMNIHNAKLTVTQLDEIFSKGH